MLNEELLCGKCITEIYSIRAATRSKCDSFRWRFCIVGFNSLKYDLPLIMLAAKGVSCSDKFGF